MRTIGGFMFHVGGQHLLRPSPATYLLFALDVSPLACSLPSQTTWHAPTEAMETDGDGCLTAVFLHFCTPSWSNTAQDRQPVSATERKHNHPSTVNPRLDRPQCCRPSCNWASSVSHSLTQTGRPWALSPKFTLRFSWTVGAIRGDGGKRFPAPTTAMLWSKQHCINLQHKM